MYLQGTRKTNRPARRPNTQKQNGETRHQLPSRIIPS